MISTWYDRDDRKWARELRRQARESIHDAARAIRLGHILMKGARHADDSDRRRRRHDSADTHRGD
jgi:hypothetical protein